MAAKRSYCGRWRNADPDKHGRRRLVCTLPAHHGGGWHVNGYTGWLWSTWGHESSGIYRDWKCHGWVEELVGICARVFRGSEDQARVRGWKIGTRGGMRDPLCPQCGKPDPITLNHIREIERSLR